MTLLTPTHNSITLAPREIVLSDAERKVVLAMREVAAQPRLGILVVQCLGTQWKVHKTTMCEHVR